MGGGGSRGKTVNVVTSGGSCSESSNSLAESIIHCSSEGRPKGFCRASYTMATLESGATWILMMFPAVVGLQVSELVSGFVDLGEWVLFEDCQRRDARFWDQIPLGKNSRGRIDFNSPDMIPVHIVPQFNQFLTNNDLIRRWHLPIFLSNSKSSGRTVTIRIHGNECETNAMYATNCSQAWLLVKVGRLKCVMIWRFALFMVSLVLPCRCVWVIVYMWKLLCCACCLAPFG